MLKWAVNGNHRQQTNLRSFKSIENFENNNENSFINETKKYVQQSLNSIDLSVKRPRRKNSLTEPGNNLKKQSLQNKENLTSTPLPLIKNSPLRNLESFRDLSNITPVTECLSTPLITPVKNISIPLNCNNSNNNNSYCGSQMKLQYAPTLPTFDVEYSPCAVIPGPIIALRGVGIADSYFEKPRYFDNDSNKNEDNNVYNISSQQRKDLQRTSTRKHNNDDSLSSSKMGDSTLNKMIDAILESARKEKHPLKCSSKLSPTYTRADDPASDLHEFWDSQKSKYMQTDRKRKYHFMDDDPGGGGSGKDKQINDKIFNEREIRTPEMFDKKIKRRLCSKTANNNNPSCQLKRQKGIRRKKKKSSLTSTVKSSAQKLFGNGLLLRKNLEYLESMTDLSPDSGKNSDSDSDATKNNSTKRRLSFSSQDRE